MWDGIDPLDGHVIQAVKLVLGKCCWDVHLDTMGAPLMRVLFDSILGRIPPRSQEGPAIGSSKNEYAQHLLEVEGAFSYPSAKLHLLLSDAISNFESLTDPGGGAW
jgi:hypothetical protein